MIKTNSLIFGLFILLISSNIFTMDSPDRSPQKKEKKQGFLQGAEYILNRLSGKQKNTKSEPFPFSDLPKDIQVTILTILTNGENATTVQSAAETINKLAQVNHNLNMMINTPDFNSKIVQILSKRFQCSNFTACAALQTKQAKKQLNLQRQLFNLCLEREPSEWIFSLLAHDDTDLGFTYDYKNQQLTPLMIATLNVSDVAVYLLKAGVDVNQSNQNGFTTLMLLVSKSQWWGIDLLLEHPEINVNQKDNNGDTALMYAVSAHTNPLIRNNIIKLLNKGADPEKTNKDGISPLLAAEELGNQQLIDLFNKAIEMKERKQMGKK